MRVDLFDFELPEERIALRPIVPRDAARLLVIDAKANRFEDRTIRDLPDLLRPQDALVVNDTRVIPGRLEGIRVRGESIVIVRNLFAEILFLDFEQGLRIPALEIVDKKTEKATEEAAQSLKH